MKLTWLNLDFMTPAHDIPWWKNTIESLKFKEVQLQKRWQRSNASWQKTGLWFIYHWCARWRRISVQVELHSLLFAVESTEQLLLGTHRQTFSLIHMLEIDCMTRHLVVPDLPVRACQWCFVGGSVHRRHTALLSPLEPSQGKAGWEDR